jgi:hypothetical protein
MNRSIQIPSIVLAIIAAVLIVGGGFGAYQYLQVNSELNKLKTSPNGGNVDELNRQLIEKVGKLIQLPEGEDPTIATISDIEKLRSQPFFARAKNGDKVVIYTTAKKAILYDPVANKIIDVAPININESQDATGSASIQSIKIALYNGTSSDIMRLAENEIENKITNTEVAVKNDASRNNYARTIVVDIKGTNSELADRVADLLDGEVGELPPGEVKPEADILVIVGGASVSLIRGGGTPAPTIPVSTPTVSQ